MDLEFVMDRAETIETFGNLEKVKDLLSTLEYIDQPINTTLSSLLQVCCQYAADDTVVKYLLDKGANPNYLDINGKDATYYTNINKNTLAGLMCLNEIYKYTDLYPKEDPMQRKQLGFDLIRSEIKKHHELIEKQNKARQKLQELCKKWEEEDGQ